MIHTRLAIPFLLSLGVAFAADLAEVDYRVRVLVRNFDAPGLSADAGAFAAEALAAALEKGGFVTALRPVYRASITYEQAFGGVQVGGVRPGEGADTHAATVDVYGLPQAVAGTREVCAPDSDYLVEGTISGIGKTWWVRASLLDRASRERIRSADASGQEEKGLLRAIQKVSAQLEPAYRNPVLERRAEAIRRSVELGDLDRAEALKRLDEMRKRWPDSLAPAAVGLLLAAQMKSPDPQAIIQRGAPVLELLPAAGFEGRRLLLRLDLHPHNLLAAAYDAAGKPDDAAAVRQAATAYEQGP